MDYVSKIVSKIYAVIDGQNTIVAEVIEGCGCGFDYLIRIDEKYKTALPIFAKCMQLCKTCQDIDYSYINASYDRGYLLGYENIALIVDKII